MSTGRRSQARGGKFTFNPGDTVRLSVKDFPTINFCGPWPAVHTFDGWYEGSALKSKGQQYTFTITQDTAILAKYVLGGAGGRQCKVLIDAKAFPNLTPIPGVDIQVSPPDLQGNGNGQTQFVRIFDETTEFVLDAPLMWPTAAPQYAFHNWDVQGAQVTTVSQTAVKLRCTAGNVFATALFEERGEGLPDLIVARLETSLLEILPPPPGCEVNCKKTFVVLIESVEVKNQGQGNAGPSQLRVFGAGLLALLPVPGLGPGQSYLAPINQQIRIPEGQLVVISATADSANQVQESDETNNTSTFICVAFSIVAFCS